MQLQGAIKKIAAEKWFRAVLPALLAAAFCLFALRSAKGLEFCLECMNDGSCLLTGIYNQNIAFNMPLYSLAGASWLNLGGSPALFFLASYFGTYLLVFSAGALLSGYWAGIVSMLAAGLLEAQGGFSYTTEQSFYSFFVMLVLALTLLDRRENTVKSSLLAGLAAGFSMLVRTPLFLFPPVFVLCGWLWKGGRSRAFALRSAVFLVAAYGLLVPWGVVRYPMSGKFSLFDDRRAAPNVISSARFTVFNMEGDARRVAGISEKDSAIDFFMREVAKNPVLFALTVVRRLWHIFLFDPLLFGLLFAALLAGRGHWRRLDFSLPVYFILIHAVLAIEKRYFYPLMYVIPPLLAGTFLPRRPEGEAARCIPAERTAQALFWLTFCAVLVAQALIAVYPARAARSTREYRDFSLALKRWPNDRMVQELGCGRLMEKGDYDGFYSCLAGYVKKFDDKVRGYFLRVRISAFPAGVPPPPDPPMSCLIMRMLREYELGDQAAAKVSFGLAYAEYERRHNMLNGEGYARDRKVLNFMRQDSSSFWERYVYEQLLLWPPEGMAKILAGIKKQAPLTQRLRLLGAALEEAGSGRRGGAGGARLRELLYGEKGLLWREAERSTKALSDAAVEKMRSGRLLEAEKLLLKAAALNSAGPEVFMNLCWLLQKGGEKKRALEACQRAFASVYSSPENRTPGLELLASEAAFASYKLLDGLGRGEEARETLRQAVANAPAAWPGLAGARKTLEGLK